MSSNLFLVESCQRGYPRLAAFLDSDESFMMYRRFGYVQSRLLLEQQDELRILEEELGEMDQAIHATDPEFSRTRDLPQDVRLPREKLIGKLQNAYCTYGKFSIACLKY
jgi:hypothetical protein